MRSEPPAPWGAGLGQRRIHRAPSTLSSSVSWGHGRMLSWLLVFSALGLGARVRKSSLGAGMAVDTIPYSPSHKSTGTADARQIHPGSTELSHAGSFTWNETQAKGVSEGLWYLFGNISQLIEKGKLGVSTMVSRKEWGAEAVGCSTPLTGPVDFLIVHDIPGLDCQNQTVCSQRLRALQAHHVHSNHWCDLAYNFLVGDDGGVYEGVGWNTQGQHTQSYNNISLGFAFFGPKEGHSPSPDALSAMEGLISHAIQKGHLSPGFAQPLLVKGENCLVPPQKASLKKVCPSIVPRSAWEAGEIHCPRMNLPAKYVIIIHTAGRTCNLSDECRLLVRDIHSLLRDRHGSCDIGYNFLVGQDGAVYEGVGWNVQGSHTTGYNDIALGVAFMGTFTGSPPNAAALEAAQNLIQCAVDKKYLSPNYLLVGHSDLSSTLSPGQALYNIIRTWPHFKH